jgi:hypothetical protein
VKGSPVVLNLGVDFTEDFLFFGEKRFDFLVIIVLDCLNECSVCLLLPLPSQLEMSYL